ncbi:hypothetical protein CGL27_09780 [Streptomyces sp. 11-1-2]|nr:hypothetical protein CGL27_09780 [Streptomyces sp. 11-1-2]
MLALFDLDNTLIDRQGGLDAWAGAFARSRGLPGQAALRCASVRGFCTRRCRRGPPLRSTSTSSPS